jgi:hypothetical protein
MDLANMRAMRVSRSMSIAAAGRQASLDVSGLADEFAVPDVRFRLKCYKCRARTDAPNDFEFLF